MALFLANQLGDVDYLFGQIIVYERQTPLFLYSPYYQYHIFKNTRFSSIGFSIIFHRYNHQNILQDFDLALHYFNIFIAKQEGQISPFSIHDFSSDLCASLSIRVFIFFLIICYQSLKSCL
ncbi:hypothetical protein Hanom_Chr09g00815531 [Helianthus anomalus]